MKTLPFPTIRTLVITTLFITLTLNVSAQNTHGINYQAILRDAQGDALANQSVALLFEVFQDLPTGTLVFSDQHTTSTNEHGLVSVVIGSGSTTGDLRALDYNANLYYMQVSVDGNALPAQKLEAVPMAYKATDMKLADLTDVDGTAPTVGHVLQWNGSTWASSPVSGDGIWTLVGNDAVYANGQVIIGGMTSAQSMLSVGLYDTTIVTAADALNEYHGNATGFGLRGTTIVKQDGTGVGLYGFSTAHNAQADSVIGVMGAASNGVGSATTYGVLGSATGTSLVRKYGVFGVASGSAGIGVFGQSTNESGLAGWFKGRLGVDDGPAMDPTSDASALLQMNSTTKGLLIPRMNTAERDSIPSPAEALLVYDTDLSATMQYSGGAWQTIGSGGGSSPWTANTTYGIEYDGLNVGVGGNAVNSSKMRIFNDSLEKSLSVVNLSSQAAPIGIHSIVQSTDAEESIGVLSAVVANNNGVSTGIRGSVIADWLTPEIIGVHGVVSCNYQTATSYGVLGETSGTGYGTSPCYGVAGRLGGNDGAGVFGELMGTGTNRYAMHALAHEAEDIALFAENTSGSGVAGYFDGDLFTTADLSVSDKVRIKTDFNTNGPGFEMFGNDGILRARIVAERGGSFGSLLTLYRADGTTGISLFADYAGGHSRVITDELEIRGGADLAEHFDVTSGTSDLLPGMLVSIAADGSGDLVTTTMPYDHRVAGIVSGAKGVRPGMTLRQEGTTADGNVPVALTGRVYVLAEASQGPIEPGDLLTSSTVPGHAMKATDRERREGAVIGKAMTSLENGTGYVLVLVNLQ